MYDYYKLIGNLYNLIYKIYNERPEVNNFITCNYIYDIYKFDST